MWPPSHTNFFSSLKQVEKRLKSENSSHFSAQSSPAAAESNYALTESLSSPIYLNLDQPNNNSSTLQDSEPPQAFISNSPEFPPTHQDPYQINGLDPPQTTNEVQYDDTNDIERLIQLLGLSDYKKKEEEESCSGGDSCHCDGGFYAKIVGFKGPKCVKEVERLEGWIKHFSSSGVEESREPLRLAHLLLGKAAFVFGENGDFDGLEFPSTIDEFLQNDLPTD